jgi:hypothetical protein
MILHRMSSNVPNWEATINKVVTSKEGSLVGNVEATDESAVLVSSEGARTQYYHYHSTCSCYSAA